LGYKRTKAGSNKWPECVCLTQQDAAALRSEVSRWESQARQRERRLAEVEQELLETAGQREALQARLEELSRQLGESHRQLDESRRQRGEAEESLGLRLRECEEELARRAATPVPVKVRPNPDRPLDTSSCWGVTAAIDTE